MPACQPPITTVKTARPSREAAWEAAILSTATGPRTVSAATSVAPSVPRFPASCVSDEGRKGLTCSSRAQLAMTTAEVAVMREAHSAPMPAAAVASRTWTRPSLPLRPRACRADPQSRRFILPRRAAPPSSLARLWARACVLDRLVAHAVALPRQFLSTAILRLLPVLTESGAAQRNPHCPPSQRSCPTLSGGHEVREFRCPDR